MKAKKPEYKSSKERWDAERALGEKKAAEEPFGWGFQEVDPTYQMMKDHNFEGFIKRHFGEKLVKSMLKLIYLTSLGARLPKRW